MAQTSNPSLAPSDESLSLSFLSMTKLAISSGMANAYADYAASVIASNKVIEGYFAEVCKMVNYTEYRISFDGYEIDGNHINFKFNNGRCCLSEFDILAAISKASMEEVAGILKLKDAIDALVPTSNFAYHTLSFNTDIRLADKLLAFTGSGKPNKETKTYLMTDQNTGYTKIGKAADCIARERTLQSEKPTISLLAVCDNQVESELHRKYKHKRLRGEWFDLTKSEIREIIAEYGFHNRNDNNRPII